MCVTDVSTNWMPLGRESTNSPALRPSLRIPTYDAGNLRADQLRSAPTPRPIAPHPTGPPDWEDVPPWRGPHNPTDW